jgi:hypothetical protein
MSTLAYTTQRRQRMESECAAAAGQARLLGVALAILVAALGFAAAWV